MFKKQTTRTSSKALYGYLKRMTNVFIVATVVCLMVQSSAAVSIASFDTMLQNAYVSAKQGMGLKDLPGTMEKGNIYSQALKVVDEKSTVAMMDTIIHTTHALNHLNFATQGQDAGSCDLQTTDTLALLSMVPSIASELRKQSGESSRIDSEASYESFWSSCSKLFACYNDQKITERKQLEYCKNIVADAYYMGKINANHQVSLDTVNYGDNVFVDNRLDNSSFDIMVDIKRIGDILFEGNKEPAEILFYRFPTVDIPDQSDTTTQGGVSGLGFGESSQIVNNNSNTSGTTGSTPQSGSGNLGASTGSTQSPEAQSIDDFINQINENNPIPSSNSLSVINNNVCIVPEAPEALSEQENIQAQLDQQLAEIFAAYANLLNDPLNPTPISSQFTAGAGGGIANDIDSARAIEDAQRKRACTQECEANIDPDASQFEQERQQSTCEAGCCIQKCEPLGFTDKIVCTTDCLCDEIASENNTFKIKFCKIPVKAESPVPKKVQSVEEILNELANVVKYLQQQGEPMKREKTKEFMETSLKGVKLSQLFFFDIFVKFKPIFEEVPGHVIEQGLQEQNKKNVQTLLNAGTLVSPYERNKYLIIDNPTVLDATKDVKGELSDLKANVEEAVDQQLQYAQEQAHIFEQRQAMLQQQALQQSTSLVGDEVSQFFDSNMKFWIEVNDALGQMNQYSEALNKKIQDEK